MGSMGKRRGRRTRSDEGGSRHDLEDGIPVFRHDPWTPAGTYERWIHLHRELRSIGRGERKRPEYPVRYAVEAGVVWLIVLAVFVVLLRVAVALWG